MLKSVWSRLELGLGKRLEVVYRIFETRQFWGAKRWKGRDYALAFEYKRGNKWRNFTSSSRQKNKIGGPTLLPRSKQTNPSKCLDFSVLTEEGALN